MIRGDKVPLAICTVTSSTEKKKMTNVSIAAAMIPITAREPCIPKSRSVHWKRSSNCRIIRAQISATNIERAGITHNEFLENAFNRFR